MKRFTQAKWMLLFGSAALLLVSHVTMAADEAPAAVTGGTELLGQVGIVLALGLGALGSSLGIGAAGMAAAGAWAKEAKEGKTLTFSYIILIGMPMSQTLYAMILMNQLGGLSADVVRTNSGLLLGIGLAGGLGEMFSAWMQGKIGAAAVRCLSEGEGKGFTFLIIAMGIAETIGILTLAFLFMVMPG